MAKYIVTGGAGFIGSNIVQELVRRGHKVKIIDNLFTGKIENLKSVAKKINFVKGMICNLPLLQKEFRGFDYVLHQAALSSVPGSIANPTETNRNNIDGTLNILTAAKDQKIKRVIFASSSSVYGDIEKKIISEDDIGELLSPYALTKFSGEVYCRLFYKIYGLETIALRYFNVFGPNQDPKGQYAAVIPKFIKLMLAGERPVIYGDGTQSRDFIFVKDIVSANILAATARKGIGEVFNIASGQSISINQLVRFINKELKKDIKPVYVSQRSGDIKHSKASIKKAKKIIGFEPKVCFNKGLRETIQWYKKKRK